jgi:hypothetical protein
MKFHLIAVQIRILSGNKIPDFQCDHQLPTGKKNLAFAGSPVGAEMKVNRNAS